ncbi:MAG: Sugar phosphate isomerase/epimerase [Myxococcales bacterium]|nr:Sugar phosphate isomerase/epimerase [Myxococcales bacterium]
MNRALTTAFASARQDGDEALSPAQIVDLCLRAEASGVILDGGLRPALYEPLVRELQMRGDELPLVAIEVPCPNTSRPGGRAPELAAPDRDEASAALEAAITTIRHAGELRAPFVVVRLGEVRASTADWAHARDKFLRGALDESLTQRMSRARNSAAERAIDGARRALDRLAREAERAGALLLVRNGRRYVDVPTPRELDRLRADLRGAPVMPLLDVPAAHLNAVMGFAPMALTLAAYADAPLCYYGDACGPIGALAPGHGIVDLAAVQASVSKEARLAFSPWGGLSLDEVVEALQTS